MPHGLFQKGTSRCWLDDNGYFFIVAGFEPVSWSKGSCLSVGVSFLWEASEDLNGTLAYNHGGRLAGFCEYGGDDDKFQMEMEEFYDCCIHSMKPCLTSKEAAGKFS